MVREGDDFHGAAKMIDLTVAETLCQLSRDKSGDFEMKFPVVVGTLV